MPNTKKSKQLTTRYKKQHGLHHKHNGKYIKVYWPYLPVLVFVLTGIAVSVFVLTNKHTSADASSNISAQAILNDTNQSRATANLQSLNLNKQLSTAAQIKANDMAKNNYWSPISPTGKSPWQIIKSTGYQYKYAGENLAYGFSDSKTLTNAWLNSNNHRLNILNSSFDDIGIGVAVAPNFQNQGTQTIVVALYGSSMASPNSVPIINGPSYTSNSIALPSSQAVLNNNVLSRYNKLFIFSTGLFVGMVGCYLVVTHGLLIKKWALEGEELIIKHPILDVILVIFILGLVSLNQTVGIIS